MKNNTMKLLESIENNLNESVNLDWFKEDGLSIAKGVAEQEGNLKCCQEVSKAVVEGASKDGISCKILDCGVITRNEMNSSHTVVQIDGGIVDYTQKQFFGSSNPEDCIPNIIGEFKDIDGEVKAYTNNTFKDKEGNNINYFSKDLIEALNNNKVVPDVNDYIIYVL